MVMDWPVALVALEMITLAHDHVKWALFVALPALSVHSMIGYDQIEVYGRML